MPTPTSRFFKIQLTLALLAASVSCSASRQDSVWNFRTDRPWLAGDSDAFTPVVDHDSAFFCGGYFWNDEKVPTRSALNTPETVKGFELGRGRTLQFRAECFNFINHPNWGGGSGGGVNFNPTNANFGKVTTKGGGVGGGERNLQLSLRFYF